MPRIKKTVKRWFPVPNDPDKGKIEIKHLSPGEIEDISAEAFLSDAVYEEGKKGTLVAKTQSTSTEQLRNFTKLSTIRSITNWKNFFDDDGKLMKCNEKNIILFIREFKGFQDMVAGFKAKLAKDIKKENKAQEKNLKGSAPKPAK